MIAEVPGAQVTVTVARKNGTDMEADARTRRKAYRVLADLEAFKISPTPQAFEVWHAHLDGSKPDMSQKLLMLLKDGHAPTTKQIEALHAEHFRSEDQTSLAWEKMEALGQEAHCIVEDVNDGTVGLVQYGEILADCYNSMDPNWSLESLARAVAMLTTETTLATERNRALTQKLFAATARVTRLTEDLSILKREAMTDSLTGLCNRKAFDSRLHGALAVARTDGTPVSLLLLDLDHFKSVNDAHGHLVGDLVLRLFARVLRENVKGRDTASRYGGEEFALILLKATGPSAAIVAEQIREAVASKSLSHRSSGTKVKITVSVGVAEHRPGESASSLIGRADEALYRAKNSGRNCVCFDADVRQADT